MRPWRFLKGFVHPRREGLRRGGIVEKQIPPRPAAEDRVLRVGIDKRGPTAWVSVDSE